MENRIRALLSGLVVLVFAWTTSAAITEAWVQRYNGPASNSEVAIAVAIDLDGNVAVTGWSRNSTDYDLYTVKYAATNGAVIWTNRYNGPGIQNLDEAQDMAVDGRGNVFVLAESGPAGTNKLDFLTAKFAAADGALLWERRYNGVPTDNVYPSALRVDAVGDVVIAGTALAAATGKDYYTAKYSGTNGTLLWERRYNAFAAGSDEIRAMALDPAGNVVVTGISDPVTSIAGYYTAKYASTNGGILWQRRYTGPASGLACVPVSINTDRNGNVFMAGYTSGTSGLGEDYYIGKFAGTNGGLLWENRYNGPANGLDEALSMALDSHGNPIVTGYSHNGADNDYATVKFSGTNGALLWVKRYDHPLHGGDLAYAVAVDSSNNIVVTGRSDGTNVNFYTVSYAGTDGAMLWERYYNGPANKFDGVTSSRALAIGSDGRVAVTGVSAGDVGITDFADIATVVYRENFAPLITCPSNIIANCSGNGHAIVNFTIEATDESGVAPTLVCVPPSGSSFPLGQTTVTCTVMDSDQLSNTCAFTVTVLDLEPPVVNCPSNLVLEFSSAAGAEVTYSVSATDLCDSIPLLMCVPPSGAVFPIGETTVQCTARDASENSNVCTFTVTVLGARGTKYNSLANLVPLLPQITIRSERQMMERAIEHLIKSLEPRWWVDETHVIARRGRQVFMRERVSARNLCSLSDTQTDGTEQTLQEVIDRIIRSDRLLASVAIEEANPANLKPGRIEQANQLLVEGDRAATHGNCGRAIELYQRAWRKVR